MTRTSEASKLTCDCGCGNFLSQGAVNIGIRYIRGHKPKGNLIHKNPKFHWLPPSGVLQTSVDSMKEFVSKQRELLVSQRNIAFSESIEIKMRVEDLDSKIQHWNTISEALEKL
jgi:hypothetical protein